MTFKLGLAQTCHPADGDTVALVARVAEQAAAAGVDLLVFPESLMSRYEAEREQFLHEAQPLDGAFTTAVDAIAAEQGLWMVYTMNERNPDGGLPFNTAVLVDAAGQRQGVYRKIHLFDSHTTQESERMSAFDELFEPVETPFATLGIGICYDLRFPELSRHAALHGAELMLYPSAWVAGEGKVHHWQTLLAARAIENEFFVAGVCRADEGYVGTSLVVAPDGSVLVQGDGTEGLLTCEINLDELRRMREQIPVFEHRRPDVYDAR